MMNSATVIHFIRPTTIVFSISLCALLLCSHAPTGSGSHRQATPLGSLHILMQQECEAFFRTTPQVRENKDSLFMVDIIEVMNGFPDTITRVRINLHGEGSIKFPRKSIEMKTAGKHAFFHNPGSTDEFFIIAMEEDSGYFRGFLGYSLLAELNLFFCHFEYIKVFFNGSYQGIYLFVEKSQEAIKDRIDSVVAVYRRNYDKLFEVKYLRAGHEQYQDTFRQMFASLYTMNDSLHGHALSGALNSVLRLDDYYRWLAVNTLVQNGDYLDEVFFYITPSAEAGRFRAGVAGWDYEDIFKPPHSGNAFVNSLVYCSEEPFDSVIVLDSVLYASFCAAFENMLLHTITPEFLLRIKESVLSDCAAQFNEPATCAVMNNFYGAGAEAADVLEEMINNKFDFLIERRDSILHVLKGWAPGRN
jgi:hypothetical protein